MSKEVAVILEQAKERFLQIAPSSMNYEAEKGFAMQILMGNSYLMKVAQGNEISLMQAISNVAAIGLSLNLAKKEAYLLSRNVKIDGKFVNKIVLEPSYMGLCNMATSSGVIEWVQSNAVYDADKFIDNGPGMRPTHEFDSFAKSDDRGPIVGVYCVAKTSTRDYLTETMRIDEINDIMERSESVKAFRKNGYGSSPWLTDFNQQALKTVVRRAFKMWPKSDGTNRMAEAVEISNQNEGFEPLVSSPNINQFTAEQKNYFDQMIEKGDKLGMYVFAQSFKDSDTDLSIWTSLNHSFPKGEKGKYRQIVDGLVDAGKNMFLDMVSGIEESIDDEVAIFEIIEGLDNDTIDMLADAIPSEMETEFRRIFNNT